MTHDRTGGLYSEGEVSTSTDHFELVSDDFVTVVARVGRDGDGDAVVEFTIDAPDLVRLARVQLERHLSPDCLFGGVFDRTGRRDWWESVRKHCGTASNVYGRTHWRYRQVG